MSWKKELDIIKNIRLGTWNLPKNHEGIYINHLTFFLQMVFT